MKSVSFAAVASSLAICSSNAQAQSVVISKIYHPYVDALESEIEYQALLQDEQHGIHRHRSILEAWEGELKWQLTEQGEYGVDWGLLERHRISKRSPSGVMTVNTIPTARSPNLARTLRIRIPGTSPAAGRLA